MKWKDITTYSRGEDPNNPSCWSITLGPIRVVVMKDHRWYPNDYVMTCAAFGIDTAKFGVSVENELEVAQEKALDIIRLKVKEIQDGLDNIS